MADDHSTQRREIAKRYVVFTDPKSEKKRIPYDEKQHGRYFSEVELIGSPKSWILLDYPNRLVDRYDPKGLSDRFERMDATPDCPLYVGIDVFSLHPVFLYVETGEDTWNQLHHDICQIQNHPRGWVHDREARRPS
jgi:hypothetical protein